MLVSSFLCGCIGCFVLICLLLVLQPGFVWLFSCILLFRLLSVVCDGSGDWLVVVAGCFVILLCFGRFCSVWVVDGLVWLARLLLWFCNLLGLVLACFGFGCYIWLGGGLACFVGLFGLAVGCSVCGFVACLVLVGLGWWWYGYFGFDDYAALYAGCCLDWFGGLVVGLFVYLRLLSW